MKKIFVLTVIASLAYFSSSAQAAVAKRYSPAADAPKKTAEIKTDDPLAVEKAAKAKKVAAKKAELKKAEQEKVIAEKPKSVEAAPQLKRKN